jgi:hypothetical protein
MWVYLPSMSLMFSNVLVAFVVNLKASLKVDPCENVHSRLQNPSVV